MQTETIETTAGKLLKIMQRIQSKIKWYKRHHSYYDDLSYMETRLFMDKAAEGPEGAFDSIYDCYRFAFARGYAAAQREAKKKGMKA